MSESILAQELAPLQAQIAKIRPEQKALEVELQEVLAELDRFSAEREIYDTLRNACDSLDRLTELEAGDLFWGEGAAVSDPVRHMQEVRNRIAAFEGKISAILEKQSSIEKRIDEYQGQLNFLNDEILDAYEREEKRKEEFVIVREISEVPYRQAIMPWARDMESERLFRRAILIALLICLFFGSIIPMITVPKPESYEVVAEIPERLVKLVKEEQFKPEPVQQPEKPEEEETDKKKPKEADEAQEASSPESIDVPDAETVAAREKVQHVGVMKFKNAFADLMKETQVAKLGGDASLSGSGSQVRGASVASRSIVSIAGGGSSGGIASSGVSRNLGTSNADRIGGGGDGVGYGFVRAESSIAGLERAERLKSDDGISLGRTDEEIQIVFDRYKASLYRIYNRELRKDPTLRGKILIKIAIEPSGAVSLCTVESTDLHSETLVAKILERVKQFNFGPKEGAPKVTILYPIDFLPAG